MSFENFDYHDSLYSNIENRLPLAPLPGWHQLVVIGNGFDLECGLPSSFASFIADRKNKFNEQKSSDEASRIPCPYQETVWDVILEKMSNSNWCDIEGAIANWVLPKKYSYSGTTFNRVHEILSCLKGEYTTYGATHQKYSEKIIVEYIKEKVGNDVHVWGKPELYTYYRSELTHLEHDFDEYLSMQLESSADYKERARNLVGILLSEERPDEDDFDIRESILSFNYTRISEQLRMNGKKVNYVNIHGRLGKEIIFGIDGAGILSDLSLAPFTKTYRLMNFDLPDIGSLIEDNSGNLNAGTALIKFYGHSLGEADYSYFQAIFDSLQLYERNTRLIFYFRPYGEFDEENARKEMMNKTIKMLSAYGETLDNKDHGKNLIHKLLLEGRLSVKLLPNE